MCEIGFQAQVGQADNSVHRGADLVAHIGQEGAFGHIGALCLAAGFFSGLKQLAVANGRAHLGDVALDGFDLPVLQFEGLLGGYKENRANGLVFYDQGTQQERLHRTVLVDKLVGGASLGEALLGHRAAVNGLHVYNRCSRKVVACIH